MTMAGRDITNTVTRSQRIRLALLIAWPVVLENILVALVNMIDTAMVSSLGAYATSAVALCTTPAWVLNSVIMSANVGCSVLVAHRVGAKDWKGARQGARESLVLGFLFGLVFMTAIELLSAHIPVWMGGAPDVTPYSTEYLRIVALGYPFYFMGLVLCGSVRGAGDTLTPMLVTSLADILNVIGNFFLIYEPRRLQMFWASVPVWGAGLGIRGAAMATAAATAFSGITAAVLCLRKKEGLYLRLRESYRLVVSDLKEIFYVGLPTAAERMAISIGQIFFVKTVTVLGTVIYAGHHLAITAESICYTPGYGLQAAGTALTGQAIGAGREDLAESYARITIWLGTGVMALIALLMFVFADPFIGLFTPDPEVRAYGVIALRIVAFAEPFFAMQIVGSGVLRALGDVKVTVPISLFCMWLIRLPLAALFVRKLHLGLAGAWYAMDLDLLVRGSVTMLRFYSGKWKKLYRKHYKGETGEN